MYVYNYLKKVFYGWVIWLIGLPGSFHSWIPQMDSQYNEWSDALKRDRKNWNKRPFSCRPLHNCPHLFGSFEIPIPAILTRRKCDPLWAFMTILLISSPFHNNWESFGLVFLYRENELPSVETQIAFQGPSDTDLLKNALVLCLTWPWFTVG